MDSRITATLIPVSTLLTTETIEAPLVSRGLILQPLRTFDGSLETDLAGNVLYEITARYQSVMTKESFITITV